jgi:hypothetical protein
MTDSIHKQLPYDLSNQAGLALIGKYTPHALANVLRRYTSCQLQGLWFFNRMSLLAIATRADASRQ